MLLPLAVTPSFSDGAAASAGGDSCWPGGVGVAGLPDADDGVMLGAADSEGVCGKSESAEGAGSSGKVGGVAGAGASAGRSVVGRCGATSGGLLAGVCGVCPPRSCVIRTTIRTITTAESSTVAAVITCCWTDHFRGLASLVVAPTLEKPPVAGPAGNPLATDWPGGGFEPTGLPVGTAGDTDCGADFATAVATGTGRGVPWAGWPAAGGIKTGLEDQGDSHRGCGAEALPGGSAVGDAPAPGAPAPTDKGPPGTAPATGTAPAPGVAPAPGTEDAPGNADESGGSGEVAGAACCGVDPTPSAGLAAEGISVDRLVPSDGGVEVAAGPAFVTVGGVAIWLPTGEALGLGGTATVAPPVRRVLS